MELQQNIKFQTVCELHILHNTELCWLCIVVSQTSHSTSVQGGVVVLIGKSNYPSHAITSPYQTLPLLQLTSASLAPVLEALWSPGPSNLLPHWPVAFPGSLPLNSLRSFRRWRRIYRPSRPRIPYRIPCRKIYKILYKITDIIHQNVILFAN